MLRLLRMAYQGIEQAVVWSGRVAVTRRALMSLITDTALWLGAEQLIEWTGDRVKWVKENEEWLLILVSVGLFTRSGLSVGGRTALKAPKSFFVFDSALMPRMRISAVQQPRVALLGHKTAPKVRVSLTTGEFFEIAVDAVKKKLSLFASNKEAAAALATLPIAGLSAVLSGDEDAMTDLAQAGLALLLAGEADDQTEAAREYFSSVNTIDLMRNMPHYLQAASRVAPLIGEDERASLLLDSLETASVPLNGMSYEAGHDLESGFPAFIVNDISMLVDVAKGVLVAPQGAINFDGRSSEIAERFAFATITLITAFEETGDVPLFKDGDELVTQPALHENVGVYFRAVSDADGALVAYVLAGEIVQDVNKFVEQAKSFFGSTIALTHDNDVRRSVSTSEADRVVTFVGPLKVSDDVKETTRADVNKSLRAIEGVEAETHGPAAALAPAITATSVPRPRGKYGLGD